MTHVGYPYPRWALISLGSGSPSWSKPDARSKGQVRRQRTECLQGGHGMQAGLLQMSEWMGNLREGTICEDRESNDFGDGAEGPEF